MSDVKKVVLAYSGGLDTSIILKWLREQYQCEVVTFTADVGQGEEVNPLAPRQRPWASRKYTSMTYARNLLVTSSTPCSAPTRFTKANTC